jgi:H+-transporting ATPase
MLANDFVTISIATDNEGVIAKPTKWNISRLILASSIIAIVPLISVSLTYLAALYFGFTGNVIRTAIYLALVYYGMSTLFAIRSWPHGWSLKPSRTLIEAMLVSFIFALLVSISGIVVPPIPIFFVIFVVLVAIIGFFLTDLIKNMKTVKRFIGEI